jgi:hypothetical protein
VTAVAGSKRARRAQRGTTLTLFAIAGGITLIGLGSVFLNGSEQAYRFSVLRAREAALYAAADGGLIEAVEALKRGDRKIAATSERGGVRLEVGAEIDERDGAAPGSIMTIVVSAASGVGNDLLKRTVIAKVDVTNPSGPRFLSARRY